MKKIIKNNLISLIVITVLFVGVGTAYAMITTSGNFPTSVNYFQDGNVINSGDWNNIETTIGNRATTSTQTLFGKLNDIMSTTSMKQLTTLANLANVGTSGATTTYSGGINLTGSGCVAMAGTCIGSGGGGSGATTTSFSIAPYNATTIEKAHADYVLTGNAASDDTTIATALSTLAASSNGSGVLQFYGGTVYSSTTISNNVAGICIAGAGARSTTIYGTSATAVMKIGNRQTSGIMRNNVCVRDLQLTSPNTTATVLKTDGIGQGSYFSNITANGGKYGFEFEDLDRVYIDNIYAGNNSVAGIRNMTGLENTWGTVSFTNISTVGAVSNYIGVLWDTDWANQTSPNAPTRVTINNALFYVNTGLTGTVGMQFNTGVFAFTVSGSLFENNDVQVKAIGTTSAQTVNASFLGNSYINNGTNSTDIFQFNNYNHNVTVADSHFQQGVNVFNGVSGFSNVVLNGRNQNQGNLTNIWTGSWASRTGTDTDFAGANILSSGLSATPFNIGYFKTLQVSDAGTATSTVNSGGIWMGSNTITSGYDNLLTLKPSRTYGNSGAAAVKEGVLDIDGTLTSRILLNVMQGSTAGTGCSPECVNIEQQSTTATGILMKIKTASTQFSGNLAISVQGKRAPAIELNEDIWNGGTNNQGQGLFQINSHDNAFRIDSRNNTNTGYCSDYIQSSNFATTTYGKITLFNCTSSAGNSAEGSARLNLFGTSTVANLVNFTSLQGATEGDRFVIKQAGNVGIGTTSPYTRLGVAGTIVADNYIATSTTATSTFAGPIAISGYVVATTTTVCIYPEHCTYQVSPTSTSSDVQINAAMLAMNRTGGGTVNVKHGTYIISDILQIPSNVNLVGAGIDITTIKSDVGYRPATTPYGDTNARVMLIGYNSAAISNNRISDITWDANVQNITGLTSNATHRTIEIRNATNLYIENNKLINGINWIIFVDIAQKVWIRKNIVLGGYSSTYDQNDGVHIRNAKGFFIQDNYIDTKIGGGTSGDDAIAMVTDADATEDMMNGVVSGNVIAGSGSRGIIGDFGNTTFNIRDIVIANNVIASTTHAGIKLYTENNRTARYYGITITGNTFFNIGTNGSDGGNFIRLDKDYGVATRVMYENIIIANNNFRTQSDSSAAWYALDVLGGATDITISGNTFDQVRGLGGIKLGDPTNTVTDYVINGNKVNVSDAASSVKGIYLYDSKRGTVNDNNIYGHTTGTTDCIYMESTAALTTTYNDVSHNSCFTFDNGIREVNSGANPDFNQYIGNVFNTVTTPYTLVGSGSGFFTKNGANFGIGTSTPSYLLQLQSSTLPQFALTDSTNIGWAFRNAGGNFYLGTTSPTTLATTTQTALTITRDGFVGIGSNTTPATNLEVIGNIRARRPSTAGQYVEIESNSASGMFLTAVSDTSSPKNLTINNQVTGGAAAANTIIAFQIDDAEVGRFHNNGYFSIATTTPVYPITGFSSTLPQLSLSAGANIAQWTFRNAGGNLYIATTTTAGTATSTTASLWVDRNGIISFGNYANCNGTSNALGVTSGQVLCDSLVSDQRLKKDITSISDGLSTILKLKPVTFNWKDLTNHNTSSPLLQYGFIAQDVQKIIPSAVGKSPDGYLTLDKTALISPMVSAIQTLNDKINNITGEAKKSFTDNWQWLVMGLMFLWIVRLEIKTRK